MLSNKVSISHGRQCFFCFVSSQNDLLCRSLRKNPRRSGLCTNDWRITFIKQVDPRLFSPLRPRKSGEKRNGWIVGEKIEASWAGVPSKCDGILTGRDFVIIISNSCGVGCHCWTW